MARNKNEKNEYLNPQRGKIEKYNIIDQLENLANGFIRPDHLFEEKPDEDPRKK